MKEPQSIQGRSIEFVAVINSFNRRELLEKALASLTRALREAPFGWAVIVFEAGSTDGAENFSITGPRKTRTII